MMEKSTRYINFYNVKDKFLMADIRPASLILESRAGISTHWMNSKDWEELEDFLNVVFKNYSTKCRKKCKVVEHIGIRINLSYTFKKPNNEKKWSCLATFTNENSSNHNCLSQMLTDKVLLKRELWEDVLVVAVCPTSTRPTCSCTPKKNMEYDTTSANPHLISEPMTSRLEEDGYNKEHPIYPRVQNDFKHRKTSTTSLKYSVSSSPSVVDSLERSDIDLFCQENASSGQTSNDVFFKKDDTKLHSPILKKRSKSPIFVLKGQKKLKKLSPLQLNRDSHCQMREENISSISQGIDAISSSVCDTNKSSFNSKDSFTNNKSFFSKNNWDISNIKPDENNTIESSTNTSKVKELIAKAKYYRELENTDASLLDFSSNTSQNSFSQENNCKINTKSSIQSIYFMYSSSPTKEQSGISNLVSTSKNQSVSDKTFDAKSLSRLKKKSATVLKTDKSKSRNKGTISDDGTPKISAWLSKSQPKKPTSKRVKKSTKGKRKSIFDISSEESSSSGDKTNSTLARNLELLRYYRNLPDPTADISLMDSSQDNSQHSSPIKITGETNANGRPFSSHLKKSKSPNKLALESPPGFAIGMDIFLESNSKKKCADSTDFSLHRYPKRRKHSPIFSSASGKEQNFSETNMYNLESEVNSFLKPNIKKETLSDMKIASSKYSLRKQPLQFSRPKKQTPKKNDSKVSSQTQQDNSPQPSTSNVKDYLREEISSPLFDFSSQSDKDTPLNQSTSFDHEQISQEDLKLALTPDFRSLSPFHLLDSDNSFNKPNNDSILVDNVKVEKGNMEYLRQIHEEFSSLTEEDFIEGFHRHLEHFKKIATGMVDTQKSEFYFRNQLKYIEAHVFVKYMKESTISKLIKLTEEEDIIGDSEVIHYVLFIVIPELHRKMMEEFPVVQQFNRCTEQEFDKYFDTLVIKFK